MNPANPLTGAPPFPSQPGDPTWEIAHLFPTQGQWTEAEYLALDTNHLIELSEGRLEFLPMPTVLHQLIVQYLYRMLDQFVLAQASGRVLLAPLPVRLWPGKFREPDLIYLRPGHVGNVRGQPNGADLVMEVVSEGTTNRERDLDTKRREYAAAGIAECWIVDPQEQQINVLALDGTTYRVHGTFRPGEQATSVLLPGFIVAVEAVFAAGRQVV